jgi:DNA modification methylase
VAAKKLGRKYIGIDISPEYCQMAEDRIKKGHFQGKKQQDMLSLFTQ